MTTKGRKATAVAAAEKPVIDHAEVEQGQIALTIQAEQQLAAQENALTLAKQLGYEGALTLGGLEEEIGFYQRRSVEAVLELGKRLLLLKEVAGHGEFAERLDGLGFNPRLAQQFMGATLKFSNTKSTSLLALPNLSQTKLLELLVLDEGEIEALDQGETVRGVKLDDVECMSVSELRRALRQSRVDKEADVAKVRAEQSGDLAAKDKVIAQKTQRIAELVEAKNRREGMTDAENHAELERALSESTLLVIGDMQVIRKRIHDIRALDSLSQGLYVGCANALQRIVSEAMSIADDYGIELTLAADLQGDELMLDNPNADEVFGPAE